MGRLDRHDRDCRLAGERGAAGAGSKVHPDRAACWPATFVLRYVKSWPSADDHHVIRANPTRSVVAQAFSQGGAAARW